MLILIQYSLKFIELNNMIEIKLENFKKYMIDIFNPYPINNGLSLYELLIHIESRDMLDFLLPFHRLFL